MISVLPHSPSSSRISKDSVFNRFGLAMPADRWVEEAQRILAAAGYEADFEDATAAAEMVARLLFAGIGAVKRAVVRNPRKNRDRLAVGG